MPLFPPHRVTALDTELRTLCDVIRGASRELTEVRRRQAELVDMESALVVAIEVRMRRVDDLLDQRCEIAGGGDAVPSSRPRSAGAPDASVPAPGHVPTTG